MSKNHSQEVLENLGFDRKEAAEALQKTNGKFDKALEMLVAANPAKEEYLSSCQQYSL